MIELLMIRKWLNQICFPGRLKCVACRTVISSGEASNLKEDQLCRETFLEGIRKYRENKSVGHHWVKRTNLKGKCKGCGKSFQGKLAFGSSKEVVGESCSWCKYSYHTKEQCQKEKSLDEFCDLGVHKSVIVPSTWILKVPRKGQSEMLFVWLDIDQVTERRWSAR